MVVNEGILAPALLAGVRNTDSLWPVDSQRMRKVTWDTPPLWVIFGRAAVVGLLGLLLPFDQFSLSLPPLPPPMIPSSANPYPLLRYQSA